MKGSRPLVDIPSHEMLGAINPNEEVAGPHSPSISGARRHVWGSPTVARSFISAAAMPFFHVRQSRRLFAAAYHLDIASFGCSFASHRIFSFILFRSFALFSRSFFHRIVILFFDYVLRFHRYIFRTHAALRAILAFQILSVHFVFLQCSHAFRYRKSVYASRCPSYFIFQRFHIKGRIAKTTHEGKTRKCTGCDTSIQPGVH